MNFWKDSLHAIILAAKKFLQNGTMHSLYICTYASVPKLGHTMIFMLLIQLLLNLRFFQLPNNAIYYVSLHIWCKIRFHFTSVPTIVISDCYSKIPCWTVLCSYNLCKVCYFNSVWHESLQTFLFHVICNDTIKFIKLVDRLTLKGVV